MLCPAISCDSMSKQAAAIGTVSGFTLALSSRCHCLVAAATNPTTAGAPRGAGGYGKHCWPHNDYGAVRCGADCYCYRWPTVPLPEPGTFTGSNPSRVSQAYRSNRMLRSVDDSRKICNNYLVPLRNTSCTSS